MRNYKLKKTKNWFGETFTKEQIEYLKNKDNGYYNLNGIDMVFEKYVGEYLQIFIHESCEFLMFCYSGECCRPFTPAELHLEKFTKETQKNIKNEIKKLKELGII